MYLFHGMDDISSCVNALKFVRGARWWQYCVIIRLEGITSSNGWEQADNP